MLELPLDRRRHRHHGRPTRSRIRPLDPRAVAAQSILIPFAITLLQFFTAVAGLAFSVLHFIPFSHLDADLVAMAIVLIAALTVFYYLSYGKSAVPFLSTVRHLLIELL